MNAKSLFLGHHFERADFADTDAHTRPMVWLTDPETADPGFMHLHRVALMSHVPADALHAANDMDAEDELSYGIFKETLLYSLVAVATIVVSVYQPWQWF